MEELFVYRVAGNINPKTVKLPNIEGLQELWDAKTSSILARSCSAEKRIAALRLKELICLLLPED